MHFQNKRRGIAFALCALMLSLSITSAHTIPVHASTLLKPSLYKIVDMALSKTGIVANSDIINAIADEAYTELNHAIVMYEDYLAENGLEDIAESWEKYKRDTATSSMTVIDCIEDLGINIYEGVKEGLEITVDTIANWFVGNESDETISPNTTYIVVDVVVEYLRELFDKYAEEEADYYYLPTVSPKNINPLWFQNRADYDWLVEFLSQTKYVFMIDLMATTTGNKSFTFDSSNNFVSTSCSLEKIDCEFGLIHSSYENYQYYVLTYSEDWTAMKLRSYRDSFSNMSKAFVNDEEFDSKISEYSISQSQKTSYGSKVGYTVPYYEGYIGFCTSDGRLLRVFKDLNTYKLFSVGQQPYYLNQTNDYSATNDNSVKFDGTYYENNSDSYSYDIVQNEIDNSTEINEETVNNIVNNTTSTIINNYYGSTGGEGGEGGEGDDSTTDYDDEYVKAEISGLGGALIGIALEHYDTLGNVAEAIRDGMTEVTDPINDTLIVVDDTMNNLRDTTENLSGDLTEVSGFMQSLYSFIPEKVMNLLITGSIASIGVGIWWSIRR